MLRVDDDRAVRPLAADIAGRVAVIVAQPPIGGIAVDQRIHVAGSDAEEQTWLAERGEVVGIGPARLREDADAEPLRLEQPPDDRHAEARMVDIGIAGHQDDVAAIPAENVHLRPRHRQERRRAEAMRPEFAIGKEVCGAEHESSIGSRCRVPHRRDGAGDTRFPLQCKRWRLVEGFARLSFHPLSPHSGESRNPLGRRHGSGDMESRDLQTKCNTCLRCCDGRAL